MTVCLFVFISLHVNINGWVFLETLEDRFLSNLDSAKF